jgi:hypothetical protein
LTVAVKINENIFFNRKNQTVFIYAGGIPPIIEIHREPAKKFDELKLEVETLIGVHSGAAAWKDFLAVVNKQSG